MFVLAHLGIGNKIASPWSRSFPKFPLFLGMLLPDIIDKSLYYGLKLLPDIYATQAISCTRTLGHTGIFLFVVLLCGGIARSRWLAALGLGIATHLLLDCLLDHFMSGEPSSALIALCWPLLTPHFYVRHFQSLREHMAHLNTLPIIICEMIGAAFLYWDFSRSEHWRRLKIRRQKTLIHDSHP